MRIKSNTIISGIFAAALLSAAVLAIHFLRLPVAPASDAERIADVLPPSPPAPWLPRLAAPRAVLVLDVSGSMGVVNRPADPGRLQTVAALRFFDSYVRMWREIAGDDAAGAGIAVVLFGTVAQTIDWSGDGELFLPVTEANRRRFTDGLVRYLGRPLAWGGDAGEDPRRAQDSDYAAALDAVADLVADAPSPPAVLFMTDGAMDPHPCFTPLLSAAVRERYRSCDRRGEVPATLAAVGGPPIFDRRAGEKPINKSDMPPNLDIDAGVAERLGRLLDARFPVAGKGGDEAAPLAWFPIYLDTRPWRSDLVAVRRMLSGDEANARFWGTEPGVTHCRSADELAGHFVAAFARWFHMSALEIAPGGTRFRVPDDTRALVVQAAADAPLKSLRLVRGDRAVDLAGRGRFWTGVLADDTAGDWVLVPGGGNLVQASVYLEPSYGWTLAVPTVCREGSAGELPEARLYMCRFADGTAVAGGEVYGNLPAQLPGSIRRDSGEVLPLDFALAVESGEGPRATYVAALPVARLSEGPALVTVRLDTLLSLGIPVRDPAQSRPVAVESLTRLVVTDGEGRRLPGFSLEGVPHAPGWTAGLRGDAP
ncbi:hypothetical protein KDM41_02120 [bacterium]|nr:hypothetical protein [bacterium]